jgi:hypothetical protein
MFVPAQFSSTRLLSRPLLWILLVEEEQLEEEQLKAQPFPKTLPYQAKPERKPLSFRPKPERQRRRREESAVCLRRRLPLAHEREGHEFQVVPEGGSRNRGFSR